MGLKVIVAFSLADLTRAKRIIKKLGLENDPDIILIIADGEKKVSASKVRA